MSAWTKSTHRLEAPTDVFARCDVPLALRHYPNLPNSTKITVEGDESKIESKEPTLPLPLITRFSSLALFSSPTHSQLEIDSVWWASCITRREYPRFYPCQETFRVWNRRFFQFSCNTTQRYQIKCTVSGYVLSYISKNSKTRLSFFFSRIQRLIRGRKCARTLGLLIWKKVKMVEFSPYLGPENARGFSDWLGWLTWNRRCRWQVLFPYRGLIVCWACFDLRRRFRASMIYRHCGRSYQPIWRWHVNPFRVLK